MSDDAHRLLILEGFRADNGRALLGIQRDQIEPWLEITGEMLDAVESSPRHDLFYADGVIKKLFDIFIASFPIRNAEVTGERMTRPIGRAASRVRGRQVV